MKPHAPTAGPLFGRLMHIGIVVEDLERAVASLERLAGVRAGERWESALGVRVAFLEVGGAPLELVQYTGPVVERFGPTLARREGVHHLCFRVEDLDRALAEVAARGAGVVPGFPVEGVHGRVAFLEPDPATGLITELCEPRR